MDILTYIDRVKANYSKQPEPVYNTQKERERSLVSSGAASPDLFSKEELTDQRPSSQTSLYPEEQ